MDEPFGALDAQTRTVLQEELLRVWEIERKTVSNLCRKPCAVNAKGVATEWVLDEVLEPGGLRTDDVDLKTLPFPEMLLRKRIW